MNQQTVWDAEDSLAFRVRLRQHQQAVASAREAEAVARSAYALAVRARKDAELRIRACLEEDLAGLPLFDRRVPPDGDERPRAAPKCRTYPQWLSDCKGVGLRSAIEALPLPELDEWLIAARDMGTSPTATLEISEEMARRAKADPRGMPISALGRLTPLERDVLRQNGFATVGGLIHWLDVDGEATGKTPTQLLASIGMTKTDIDRGVNGLVMLIDGYRATHRLLTHAQLQEIGGKGPETNGHVPEPKPARKKAKKGARRDS